METQAYLSTTGVAHLVVLEKHQIRSFPLDAKNQWSIGRKTPVSSPDIPLESAIAGRCHGELVNIDQIWYYVDKGSVNGTYVNGRKLVIGENGKSCPHKLENGDILQIDSANLDYGDPRGVWILFTTEPLGDRWDICQIDGKDEILIGRDEEKCDIVIPFPYISAEHVKIGKANDHYFVMDCNSLAGTWLNGKKLEHGQILKEKDRIAICDCLVIFTGNELIYNYNHIKNKSDKYQADVILRAEIETKKVPNNNGTGEKELIRDVNVEVSSGSLVALLGGSGAGKTTVMNCMNGIDTKGVRGKVNFKGVDLLKNFEQMKSLIGSVPQKEVLHPMLTVEEELREAAIIRLPADTKRKEIKQRVDNTINQLSLEGVRKNKISKCSGGEQRRVNIGIELVADRQMLCLDEPDAGLDPGTKIELFTILSRLAHEEGKSILVIIHDVAEIDMFDQIIMMAKQDNIGRLAFSGTPQEAREYFGTEIKEAYGLLAEHPEKYIKGA